MKNNSRKVLLIIPSMVVARGLENVFSDLGEFEVVGILPDLSRNSETRLKNIDADVIILDPIVFDYTSRAVGRNVISEYSNASVVALQTTLMEEESLKQYDDVIGIYDDATTIIRKLRNALETRQDSPKVDGEELSSREKEILVCVAKGMLNKEIADLYSISIYTVITHRKNITRKTGIKTVAGLTVYALLNNLIDVNSFE
ncbi:MAG: response regulator transcription factor [Bacteroidales bacterium]|nr:response regulator transcription factor [Bacteroidales bacterium]MDT3356298.1 LuxR C-terminal-related transcriptional regulator [Bacteroidota bacterium]MEE3407239.1 LuxR C-terminal-related transcriptional regulator [Candidatus Cryptobacteroides sp.]SKC37041.1 DNA-binding response regulator, NarL/FixJ family, contains REC and HTH domains [Bacteroidales bacterium WCE2008]MBP5235701.1 response regulator transcription factor [Bacteroidales bacterium]